MANDKRKKASRIEDVARSSGSAEIVDRYGIASAEYIKDYRGLDNQTGKTLARGHAKVAGYRVDPNNPGSSLRQQAGFSAEIAVSSKTNARHIIDRRDTRLARTDDVPEYGTNHPVGDHIELRAGKPDPATLSQMKFVDSPHKVLERIACGRGGGKNDLSRYLHADGGLALPSEQVEPCRAYCKYRAQDLRRQATALRRKGKLDIAALKEHQAQNFDQLRGKIRDSGMTRDEALAWRLEPLTQSGKAMLGIGHEAGLQGLRIGLATGLVFSVVINWQHVLDGEISPEDALKSLATAGALGATGGYLTAGAGALLQAGLNQSEHTAARALSQTTAPAMALSLCKCLGTAIYRYGRGDIGSGELVAEMTDALGGTAMSTMASSMAISTVASATAGASAGVGASAAVAGLAPIVVPMVAGTVGYLVASQFLQGYRAAYLAAEASREKLEETQRICRMLSAAAEARRANLEALFENCLAQFGEARAELLTALAGLDQGIAAGKFATAIDAFASTLGRSLNFPNLAAFDEFMADEDSSLCL